VPLFLGPPLKAPLSEQLSSRCPLVLPPRRHAARSAAFASSQPPTRVVPHLPPQHIAVSVGGFGDCRVTLPTHVTVRGFILEPPTATAFLLVPAASTTSEPAEIRLHAPWSPPLASRMAKCVTLHPQYSALSVGRCGSLSVLSRYTPGHMGLLTSSPPPIISSHGSGGCRGYAAGGRPEGPAERAGGFGGCSDRAMQVDSVRERRVYEEAPGVRPCLPPQVDSISRERRFRVCEEAPGFRPCLPPQVDSIRKRRFRVYEEAPGFRPGPRRLTVSKTMLKALINWFQCLKLIQIS